MNNSCQMNIQNQLNNNNTNRRSKPTHLKQKSKQASRFKHLRKLAASWLILQTVFLTTPTLAQRIKDNTLSYSQFIQKLQDGEVARVELDETTNKARVTLKGQNKDEPPKEVTLFAQNQDLIPKSLLLSLQIPKPFSVFSNPG